jgi:hypothetical protein
MAELKLDLKNPFQLADAWRDIVILQATAHQMPIDESIIAKSTIIFLDEIMERGAAFSTAIIKAFQTYQELIDEDESLV